jgi:hypothetical protein
MVACDLSIEDFVKCGKFSLSAVIKTFARLRGQSVDQAEKDIAEFCAPFLLEVQNEPSLARESPRRGKPKALTQAELIE